MRESSLEAAIVRYAKATGWYTLKLSSPGKRGVPDRIFMRAGRVLFMEIKAPGRKPTVLQEKVLRELRGAGQRAVWCDNLEDAKRILTEESP